MIYPSLQAQYVSRAFGALKAVDNVSLSIEAGQVVALLGQSGSGKSTLLRILAGLEGLDSGDVYAAGICVSKPGHVTPPEQRGLGMVFQDYALFPHLSAIQNVAFGLQALGKPAALKCASDWLDRVGLANRAHYFPHQLSGGEQQRVALARALAPQPRAVLMDEPFSGLDPQLRSDLQQTMLSTLRAANVAALIVSHDTEEALGIADHIAVMDHGKISQSGSPRDVYNNPISLAVARALGPLWTFVARAQNGLVATPFGTFSTRHEGSVIVGSRPEATNIVSSTNGTFTVSDCRGVGRFVTLGLRRPDCYIQARVEAITAPALGDLVDIDVTDTDICVFPALES